MTGLVVKGCPATMKSRRMPGHVHECAEPPHVGDQHWCSGCREYFWATRVRV